MYVMCVFVTREARVLGTSFDLIAHCTQNFMSKFENILETDQLPSDETSDQDLQWLSPTGFFNIDNEIVPLNCQKI